MANNDISEQWDWDKTYTHYHAIQLIVNVLTLATFIYGVTSWCILKKFRNYKNYVFLNAILVNFLFGTTEYLCYASTIEIFSIRSFLLGYFMTSKTHWVVVVSHMFYVDFVKVFNSNVRRIYLKSGLFGWGLSLITTLLFFSQYISRLFFFVLFNCFPLSGVSVKMVELVGFGNQVVPVTINCLFYIIIVFSLFRSYISSAQTPSNIWRRLYIATLIFILSDVLLLYSIFIKFVFTISPVVKFFINVLTFSNPLLLDVVFVILRSNRKIWYDYYISKLNQRRVENDINMRDRTARGSGDSRPVVLDV